MTTANTNPSRAVVRRGLGAGKKPADFVSATATVCSTGAQCTEVTGTAVGAAALAGVQKATTTAQTSLSARQAALLVLLAAGKVLKLDLGALQRAVTAYESVVGTIAAGDASIINKAGLLSRDANPAATALGKVSTVSSKQGKALTEAILSWPAAPGATGYAIEVNYTPANPAGPWTALMHGSARTRVVKAPAAGAQFLARVAALSSDGTQSDWSDQVLATAR